MYNQQWSFRKAGDFKWYPATVPGTVHTDLFKNKLILDPFYGANEKQLQWIDTVVWEYQTDLNISKEELSNSHIELCFKGLDTYAHVYLDDSLILEADNMFRSWAVDIKHVAKVGKNRLHIVFEPAVQKGKQAAKELPYTLPGDEKVFTRKAAYHYGWDWGPRFVTCGIWQDVELRCWNTARILNVQATLDKLTDSMAVVVFRCNIESDVDTTATLPIVIAPHSVSAISFQHQIQLRKGTPEYVYRYLIRNPKKWWCNGLGEPYLYKFNIGLFVNEDWDTTTVTLGLRTIELVNDKDSIGTSFYFRLNGVPVFVKGANYIPQDNFLPRVSDSDYHWLISTAADAHMNMLRVWGGGIYERDKFYELCDRYGIMVWQDFMFACAMYPADSAFLNNVAEEAKQQVVRLRNHPSIALWCGNNEVSEGWVNWEWQQQYHYSEKDSAAIAESNEYLFGDLLEETVSQYDGSRAYWKSSPSIGWGHKESLLHGDSHYWGVWWGMEPLENYISKTGRFVSEYGFQGMPDVSTLAEAGIVRDSNSVYDNKAPLIIDSAVLKAHQKHPTGYETITAYMQRDYKVPTNFRHYDYVSQLLQAEGMRIAIEAHRRKKPQCMGTLYWQLNDCWPVTSWSTIDYNHLFKAAHYLVKRLYKDVIISVAADSNSSVVYIVSDLQRSLNNAMLTLTLSNFDGKVIWSHKQAVSIGSNASKAVYTLPRSVLSNSQLNNIFLNAELAIGNTTIADDVHYFVKPKDMLLKKPVYTFRKGNCEAGGCFTVEANTLVKNALLTFKRSPFNLSDNYIDLLPGEARTFYLPANIHIAEPEKEVQILSLFDTFQPSQ